MSWMLVILSTSLIFFLFLLSFLFPCLFLLSSGRFPQIYHSSKAFISAIIFLFLKPFSGFLDVPLYSSLFSFHGRVKEC